MDMDLSLVTTKERVLPSTWRCFLNGCRIFVHIVKPLATTSLIVFGCILRNFLTSLIVVKSRSMLTSQRFIIMLENWTIQVLAPLNHLKQMHNKSDVSLVLLTITYSKDVSNTYTSWKYHFGCPKHWVTCGCREGFRDNDTLEVCYFFPFCFVKCDWWNCVWPC